MCYKAPGPRCSKHAKQDLALAKKNFEANETDENKSKLDEAKRNYLMTPEGIKYLESKGKTEQAKRFAKKREHAMAQLKLEQEKEVKAKEAQLRELYSPEGIESIRSNGNHELADRIEERARRASIIRGYEAGVVFKDDFRKPVSTEETEDLIAPSAGEVVLVALIQGAIAGASGKNGGFLNGVKAGMAVGKVERSKFEARLAAHERQKQKLATMKQRDDEKSQRAYEKELARIDIEQGRLDRANEIWHRRLETDCMRYLKEQERNARTQQAASRQRKSA